MSDPLDRYALYERAVQHPAHEVHLFAQMFRNLRGRELLSLREDFAGTAAVSAAWVASGPERTACAVDHDGEALAWCRDHHFGGLEPDAARRLTLLEADVRSFDTEPVDLVCAENFSYAVFQTRELLRGYFEVARANLRDDGLLVIDAQGGPATMREGYTDRRRIEDFVMFWELRRFDPISHRVTFAMHFEHGDQYLQDAFVYDWRLWGLGELQELLLEAGFASAEVWWADAAGRRAGNYRRRAEAPAVEHWVAYVVGVR